jgi:phosphoglycerate dehydrogenase-like enzyme
MMMHHHRCDATRRTPGPIVNIPCTTRAVRIVSRPDLGDSLKGPRYVEIVALHAAITKEECMNRLPQRCLCLIAGLATLLLAPGVRAEQRDRDSAEAARLIAELGLIESPIALRDQEGWKPPGVVLVRDPAPRDIGWLRAAAPGVEVIAARDDAAAIAAAPRADAVIGFCSAELLAKGTRIRWIQVLSAGVERCVSNPGFADRGILLTNMQRVAGPVMAEHVMAMTLALARGLPTYLRLQDQGRWDREAVGEERTLALEGKTMLIAGLGGIGTEVGRRAYGFGMRIIATRASNRPAPEFVSHVGPPAELASLLKEADVIVNALPLTDETTALFDAKLFAAMKPRALFINVGRGRTVVTAELVKALTEHRIGGAGLDVTDPEPLPPDHPLWHAPNVIITPHVSSDSDFGSERHWQIARENLRRYVAGDRMLSVVDAKRGY